MSKSNFDSLKNRQEQLIGLLRSRESWNTNELRRLLKVSQRTLMRDLGGLRSQGLPIETEIGRGGGIRLNSSWGLGRLQLNLSEIINLLVALATMEKIPSPILSKNLRLVRHKIAMSFPDSQRRLVGNIRQRIWIGDKASKEVLSSFKEVKSSIVEPLQLGFFENKKVKIQYFDSSNNKTTRVIEPHYLILSYPVWYVHSWDLLRNEIRTFRLDRILKCSLLDEYFKNRDRELFSKSIDDFFEAI